MTESKHTPGEWSVKAVSSWASVEIDLDACSGEWEGGHRECWIADRDGPVACAVAPIDAGNETVTKRARLIAAAPDLYAALKEVMEWISNWSPNFEQDDDWPGTKAKARAALSRANGSRT